MMLGGGILLALSASFGEMHPLPHVSLRGALALLYLIVFGSLLAFTALCGCGAHAGYARGEPCLHQSDRGGSIGLFCRGETITMAHAVRDRAGITQRIFDLRKDKSSA